VKALTIAAYILIIMLTVYIAFIRLQLHNISKQLSKRLSEKTRQPISLQLQSKELNALASNINKCLKAEENLRLNRIREEKRFKELIANISHDLRTPLTAIKGYQQLMKSGELTDTQQKKLEVAQKYTEELGQLIEHFFEYSYLLTTEPELNIERFNLTNLVTEYIVSSIPILEANNLAVSFEDTPPIYVRSDKEMVTRIIQNLIQNCVQHSNGDIEVRLITSKNVIISFRNSVKETAEIDVGKLFDRFYTGDKSRSSSTTGLGLSIVKLLAEQLGGSSTAALQDGLLDIQVSLPLCHGDVSLDTLLN
jgi:signal transduction histidine kinase